jgi:uncharacterized protein YbjT (DUF2867 family)
MARSAVIAGATGLVGRSLLERLVGDARYTALHVLGRRAPAVVSTKVRFIATDFGDLAAHAAQLAVDDVFCCLGTTIRAAGSQPAFERVDYHMVVDLARAAHQAGAKRFLVVSAVGASERAAAFYSRVKGRMEKAVGAVPFEALHIVRPSLLLGARAERRPAETRQRLPQALRCQWYPRGATYAPDSTSPWEPPAPASARRPSTPSWQTPD